MQAKDIDDRAFMAAIKEAARLRDGAGFVSRWDVAAVLAGDPDAVRVTVRDYPSMPEKVVLAKARALIRRGLVGGCACGCRGDLEVTPKGAKYLAESA